jgi:hypothetical protein
MNELQKQNLKRKRASWVYWIALSVVVVVTLALVGIIIWLVITQDLDKLYVKLGIIGSIVTVLISPLILFFYHLQVA